MTAVCTTPPIRPTEQDRAKYDCPEWCCRVDHHADVADEMNPPIHYGPEFGDVAGQMTAGAAPEAVICVDDDTIYLHDPARLRNLAAGLLEAAQWIEAHR